ncbi:dockerin type I domain-containing protein, partial [Ruminococcus flavefaciens]|uniref:dockerin type I domain-containing protein n=1 Tax=Ruminococcus flavefaciens TaxID=1265 RepID=UPI001FA73219
MRAKRLLASVLSFALCSGAVPSLCASAADGQAAATAAVIMADDTSAAVGASAEADTFGMIIGNNKTYTVNKGSVVTINLGDVNFDGMIDANDASAILVAYASMSSKDHTSVFTAAQTIAADVNLDGKADSVDASCVLSYYAYLSTRGTLPIESFLKLEEMMASTTTTATAAKTTTTTKTTSTASASKTTSTAAAKTTSSTSSSITTTAASTTGKATPPLTASSATTTTTAASVTKTSTSSATTSVSKTAATTSTTSTVSSTATSTTSSTTFLSSTTTTTTAAPTTTTTTVTSTATTTATTTAYVDPYKVHTIKLSENVLKLNVGMGGISYVTMLPATADRREIWSCSDESIAVVDNEGWIVGKSEGTCVVTVTSFNNPAVKADIKVTVCDPNKVNAIKLSKTEMSIPIGGGDISYVTMLPTNATNKKEIW